MDGKNINIHFDNYEVNEAYSFNILDNNVVIKFNSSKHMLNDLWCCFYTLVKGGTFEGARTVIHKTDQFNDLASIMLNTLLMNKLRAEFAGTKPSLWINKPLTIINDRVQSISREDKLYQTVVDFLSSKTISMPNLKDQTPKSVQRQINWLRSILGMDSLSLSDTAAIGLLNRLRDEWTTI